MPNTIKYYKNIATVFTVAIFFYACADRYERVGEEAKTQIFPQGVAQNLVLTYTKTQEELTAQDSSTSKVIAVLEGPLFEDYDNQRFQSRVFPKGLKLDFFDDKNQKSVVTSDYGIIYSQTNLIDLRGNVVIVAHDGKKLETPQLFWDRENSWIFTEKEFTYTNPQDGTVMDGEGMDFNRDFSFFNAHKTYGIVTIKDQKEE